MRIVLVGPGDIEFHYFQLLKIQEQRFYSELEQIAQALADSGTEIDLLPDKGVSLEIAKLYRKYRGKRVIATVPESDQTFGVKHLGDYRGLKVDNLPLFDEIIDTGDWFKHDMTKGLFGDAMLYLGNSPGTEIEMSSAVYLYKLLRGLKQYLEITRKKIHPKMVVSDNYSLIVYSPLLIGNKLPKEEEAYLTKFGINLFYVNDPQELREQLGKIS
jgi:hypothetical protein